MQQTVLKQIYSGRILPCKSAYEKLDYTAEFLRSRLHRSVGTGFVYASPTDNYDTHSRHLAAWQSIDQNLWWLLYYYPYTLYYKNLPKLSNCLHQRLQIPERIFETNSRRKIINLTFSFRETIVYKRHGLFRFFSGWNIHEFVLISTDCGWKNDSRVLRTSLICRIWKTCLGWA